MSHLRLQSRAKSLRDDTTDLSVVERTTIAKVLTECRGNKPKAALRLGLSRTQLQRGFESTDSRKRPLRETENAMADEHTTADVTTIAKVLQECGGNKTKAARRLGFSHHARR